MNKEWYVWKNSYGTLSVDDTEHGHYASECIATFYTRKEADAFCMDYIDESYGEQMHADDMDQQQSYRELRRGG